MGNIYSSNRCALQEITSLKRRTVKQFIVFILIPLLLFTTVSAKENPSFDCTKATTEVGKLICSDNELARKMNNINKCEMHCSLDCQQINNQIEDLTCSDTELLKLYKKMQKKYFEFCISLSQGLERIKLYKDQFEWTNSQNSADYMQFGAYNRRIFYLKEAYQERINNLEKLLNTTDNQR